LLHFPAKFYDEEEDQFIDCVTAPLALSRVSEISMSSKQVLSNTYKFGELLLLKSTIIYLLYFSARYMYLALTYMLNFINDK
jgi:hypothetical protein